MDKHKSLILIDYAKCSPCSGLICVGVCPLGILEAGENNKPKIVDVASCTQCGVCANLCPSKAIIITYSEQSRDG
ncbi:4Fe-4S dicluster domain-containing protein [Candidatus Bathyarchaeota archaeon]|nr:4Fe-4S dicluster domain-containing protein [Candidatus Bathyarchaeota archaeon]